MPRKTTTPSQVIVSQGITGNGSCWEHREHRDGCGGRRKRKNAVKTHTQRVQIALNSGNNCLDGSFYIQKRGTAMGSNMAPPYANIFIEEKHVYTNELFQKYAIYWKRLIDDVFLIWNGDESSLTEFYSGINSQIPGLTFTIHLDKYKMNFLDTMVTLKDDGSLDIDLYIKPTDKNSILHFSSCHPLLVKKSLPRSQIGRVNRIVTNPNIRKDRI
ncbi:unnamed protein product [Ranitomeya imitator]|uniref:Helix-turn-helix domain-containing protein n=1 Tax=Ranitomeya imitator TaxID=111125 RepID=A0ABN9MHA7_9NEOB|nr:unnamed protein product [Ranitomeya imitator]